MKSEQKTFTYLPLYRHIISIRVVTTDAKLNTEIRVDTIWAIKLIGIRFNCDEVTIKVNRNQKSVIILTQIKDIR